MSTIQINCPHCMRQLAADDSILGQYVDCPVCGKRFRLQVRTSGNAFENAPDRISIVPALVFQCIMLGYSVLETVLLVAEAGEEAEGVLALLGFVPLVLAFVFTSILHYKCWKAMPRGFARLTPGKAVGFLFIPFFNFYWAFPSFGGLGADCAAIAANKGIRRGSSLPGLGLTYAILWIVNPAASFVPVLSLFADTAAFVIWLLFYNGVVRLLNGLAASESAPEGVG